MFTSRKEVDAYFAGEYIVCLLCGVRRRMIGGRHLAVKHPGISVEDYQQMFGLPRTRGLVASHTAKRQAEGLQHRKDEGEPGLGMNNIFLPEVRFKAHHAARPARNLPYRREEQKKEGAKLSAIMCAAKKQRVDQRKGLIDWEAFSYAWNNTYDPLVQILARPSMPMYHDIAERCQDSPVFLAEYTAGRAARTAAEIKNSLSADIYELAQAGRSVEEISKILGISHTHTQRIRVSHETQQEHWREYEIRPECAARRAVLKGYPRRRKLTKKELEQYSNGSTITCLLCGYLYRKLIPHLKMMHPSTSVVAYRKRFGIPGKAALLTPEARAAYAKSARRSKNYLKRGNLVA